MRALALALVFMAPALAGCAAPAGRAGEAGPAEASAGPSAPAVAELHFTACGTHAALFPRLPADLERLIPEPFTVQLPFLSVIAFTCSTPASLDSAQAWWIVVVDEPPPPYASPNATQYGVLLVSYVGDALTRSVYRSWGMTWLVDANVSVETRDVGPAARVGSASVQTGPREVRLETTVAGPATEYGGDRLRVYALDADAARPTVGAAFDWDEGPSRCMGVGFCLGAGVAGFAGDGDDERGGADHWWGSDATVRYVPLPEEAP